MIEKDEIEKFLTGEDLSIKEHREILKDCVSLTLVYSSCSYSFVVKNDSFPDLRTLSNGPSQKVRRFAAN